MQKLTVEFVDSFPEVLEEGELYVSIKYGSVAHLCCCGCGEEVVTPLSPTDWKLIYNGKTVSLFPSIGNWNFDCQSHYFITQNVVRWASKWPQERIKQGQKKDLQRKKEYFSKTKKPLRCRKFLEWLFNI